MLLFFLGTRKGRRERVLWSWSVLTEGGGGGVKEGEGEDEEERGGEEERRLRSLSWRQKAQIPPGLLLLLL